MPKTISIQGWTLQAITATEKLTLMYTVDGQVANRNLNCYMTPIKDLLCWLKIA